MKKQDKIEIIFEFWNSFKGSKTNNKLDSKTGAIIHWRSHNKLTHDMELTIAECLKHYSLEDMCTAINNYAEILLGDDYFWTYVWPLSTFFSVGYTEKGNKYRKKWWRFLPETFDSKIMLKKKFSGQQVQEVEDPNPNLTNKLLDAIQEWGLCKKGFEPNEKQVTQLRLTSQKMIEFYKDRSCQDAEIWLEDLYDCLDINYLGKGDAVSIGLLCSDHLWNILIPQLLRTCGDV